MDNKKSKCAYWPKMCLLIEKVPIGWKLVYWMKMFLLTENVPIEKWTKTHLYVAVNKKSNVLAISYYIDIDYIYIYIYIFQNLDYALETSLSYLQFF